jgi:hypothetical protein
MFPQLDRCYKQLLANRDHFAAIAKGEVPYEPPTDFYKAKKELDAAKAAATASSAGSSIGGSGNASNAAARISPHGRSPSAPHLLVVDTYRVGGSDSAPINSSPRDGSNNNSNSSSNNNSSHTTPRGSGTNLGDSIILGRPSSGSQHDSLAVRTDSPSPRHSATSPSSLPLTSSGGSSGTNARPSSTSVGYPSPSTPSHHATLTLTPSTAPSTPGSAIMNGNNSSNSNNINNNVAGAPPSPLGLPGAVAAADVAVNTAALIAMAVGHRPLLRSGESTVGSSPAPPKPRTSSLGTNSPLTSSVTLTGTTVIGNDDGSGSGTSSSSTPPPGSTSPQQHTWTIHRKAPKTGSTTSSSFASPTLPPLAEASESSSRKKSTT